MVVLCLLLLILNVLAVELIRHDSCPVVRYGGSFNASDHVKNHALLGKSYKNLTISNVQQCFSSCVNDCRCVSYQLYGTRCEVSDEDRHTAPHRYKPVSGYKYYELKQRFTGEAVIAACRSDCYNGCCGTKPCQNGGTCFELCEDVKRKFKCDCSPTSYGRACEHRAQQACAAYRLDDSGVYPVTTSHGIKQFFCDTTSEPGIVWTLIESFALAKNLKYNKKPFTNNFPSNENLPNWADYRLSHSAMKHVMRHATHWRATCNYDSEGLVTTDYIRALLSEMNILENTGKRKCIRYEYINVRNISCANCTGHFRQDTLIHPFVDSGDYVKCEWNAKYGAVLIKYNWCENFGRYVVINPDHRCSASPSSTTQWWLGTNTV